jgi:hypothetical protein
LRRIAGSRDGPCGSRQTGRRSATDRAATAPLSARPTCTAGSSARVLTRSALLRRRGEHTSADGGGQLATHNAVAPMHQRGNKKGRTAPPVGPRAGLVVSGGTKGHSGPPSELRLLRALIDRCSGSSLPSQVDVERALESGLGRLMLLEGRLREQASRASGARPSRGLCEDHDLVDEIRALREAVTELRARTNAGESALAWGFVIPRRPRLDGGGYLLTHGLSPAPGWDGASGARQRACAALAVERHGG